MRVKYFGHACFLLADEQFSLIIDPFEGIGLELDYPRADFCVCSHSHFDHCAVHKVIVNEEITEENIHLHPQIKFIESFHDEVNGAKRGNNHIIIVEIGGYRVCHMGDLGEPFNSRLIDEIGSVDLLLIPIGGNYTIDSKTAYQYLSALGVKAVIPMHYKTPSNTVDIASKEEFLSYFDKIEAVSSEFDFNKPTELTVFDIDDSNF